MKVHAQPSSSSTLIILQAYKRRHISKYENYIPLNTNGDIIIHETFNLELVQVPQPSPSFPLGDPTKRCS